MLKKRILPFFIMGLISAAGVGLSGCTGDENTAAGKALYMHYCAGCHGEKGDGNGFNAKFVDPPPADHTNPDLANTSNQKMYDTVFKGGKGAAKSAKMPPFGKVLSEKEIWQLVAYMRSLHPNKAEAIKFEGLDDKRPTNPKITAVLGFPAADTEEWTSLVKKGKKEFRSYGCAACHRIGEEGGRVGPELGRAGDRMIPEWMFSWLKSPQSIYKKTKMPNFGLEDDDAKAIVAYLSTLKGSVGEAGYRGDPLFFDAFEGYQDEPNVAKAQDVGSATGVSATEAAADSATTGAQVVASATTDAQTGAH